jgi:hypothetical protein
VESLKRYKMALTIAGLGSALLLTVFLLFYFGVFCLAG